MTHQIGDKVRIKRGEHKGRRGVLAGIHGDRCRIDVEDSALKVAINFDDILNYSLAARRAWLKMPKRNVGRPIGTRVCDRVSVTVRVDRNLWDRFQEAEKAGSIVNRTAVVNDLLRHFLDHLDRTRKKAS
jgi:uncharacterized protein (DUF4415 family)